MVVEVAGKQRLRQRRTNGEREWERTPPSHSPLLRGDSPHLNLGLCNPSLSFMEQLCDCRVFSRLSKQGPQRAGHGEVSARATTMDSCILRLLSVGLRARPRGRQAPPSPPAPGALHRSPDWVMSRVAGLHLHPGPRFMLHISMYCAGGGSCRSWLWPAPAAGAGVRSAGGQPRQAVKEAKGLRFKLNQLEAEGTRYTTVPSTPLGSSPQRLLLRSLVQEFLKRLTARAVRRGRRP